MDGKKKIIIIEDEAIIAAELESTLTQLGYRIVGKARNGDRALDLLANTNSDLILLDIHIKGTKSGIDIAEIINEKYQIPFIYITSFADENTVTKASLTYPYGYIVKPFTEKDLRSNIQMALSRAEHEIKKNEIDFEAIEQSFNIKLSSRDQEILALLIEGLSYKEIAQNLYISVNTVKTYQKRIYQSFEVDSKLNLFKKLKDFI